MNYLLLARYNGHYFSLSAADRVKARDIARQLFPYDGEGMPVIPFLLADAFRYAMPQVEPYTVGGMGYEETLNQADRDAQATVASEPTINAVQPRNKGYGWLVLVDSDTLSLLLDTIGYADHGPFCQMFDIDIIPLNNDRSLTDIYYHMTPIHWG